MKAVTIANYFPVYFSWPSGGEDDTIMIGVGEAFGEKVWTDGHVLMIGDPPQPVTAEWQLDFERATRPARRETLQRLTPIGVCETGVYTALIFREGGPVIQVKYWNLIRERWPDVELYGDDSQASVVAKVNGKIVGMVMPIRAYDITELQEAICQSAKTAEELAETPTIEPSDTEDQNASPVKVQE